MINSQTLLLETVINRYLTRLRVEVRFSRGLNSAVRRVRAVLYVPNCLVIASHRIIVIRRPQPTSQRPGLLLVVDTFSIATMSLAASRIATTRALAARAPVQHQKRGIVDYLTKYPDKVMTWMEAYRYALTLFRFKMETRMYAESN